MEWTKFSRKWYRAIALLLLLAAGIYIGKGSISAAKEDRSIDEIRENVFRIETVYRAENKEYKVKSATCFLIGNTEMEQEQCVITTNQVLNVSGKEKKAVRKKHKIAKDTEMELAYRVVISSDITLEAEIQTQAQDNDYAVLRLTSTLADRRGISLGDVRQLTQDEEVVLLGYSADKNEINTYTSKVDLQNTDEVTIRYQGSSMTRADYGAPVLDHAGNLLGMNLYLDQRGKYASGISVNELKKVFDMLGMDYQSADSKYSDLGEQIGQAQKLLGDRSYTSGTLKKLEEAVAQAQEIYDDKDSGNDAYAKQIKALKEAVDGLKPKSDIYRIIIILLAAAAAVIGVCTAVVVIKAEKQKREVHYLDNQKQENMEFQEINRTMAADLKVPTAFLLQQNSGKKILISKDKFLIGSKKEMVDYCISGNPSVSRNHAMILCQKGIFMVQDNHSTNHTYLNGRMLAPYEKAVLHNQDTLRFANEEYVFTVKQ